MDGAADAQLHLPLGEVLDDVLGVGEGSGEPVKLGDDESVSLADGGQGFAETGRGGYDSCR
jgi:hypothetical protein